MAQGSPSHICRAPKFPASSLTQRPGHSLPALTDAVVMTVGQRSRNLAELLILSEEYGAVWLP